jgi:hypothetical protein
VTTYVLELRSTADYKDCRYREYTTSKRKADLFAKVPRIPFTDSGHGIVPYVREHSGRREPRNMILQDHVVDSIKVMTQPALPAKRLSARQQASVEEVAASIYLNQGVGIDVGENIARALLAKYDIFEKVEG